MSKFNETTSKNSKTYKAAVQAGNKLEMTKKQNLL